MNELQSSQSFCVAAATKVLGDKWTPRLISILYKGPNHFCALQAEIGINPRTLSARLSKLEEMGIVVKELSISEPSKPVYALSNKGKDLFPILEQMVAWGRVHGSLANNLSK